MLSFHSSSRKIKQEPIDLCRERTKNPQMLGSPFCAKNNPNSHKPNSQGLNSARSLPEKKKLVFPIIW